MTWSHGDAVIDASSEHGTVEFDDGTNSWVNFGTHDDFRDSASLTADPGFGYAVGDTVVNDNYPVDSSTFIVRAFASVEVSAGVFQSFTYAHRVLDGVPYPAASGDYKFLSH
jgi:hypothetical protein